MSIVDFKPSQVNLNGSFPPLCDTMGRCEREVAATLIVRASHARDDQWSAVTLEAISSIIKADITNKRTPVFELAGNPFARPDFFDLVEAQLARWIDQPGQAIEFTEAGFERLRRWVIA